MTATQHIIPNLSQAATQRPKFIQSAQGTRFAKTLYWSDLNDWCDEFLQEAVLQQSRPVMVDEVYQQTFDMWAVLVLSPNSTVNKQIIKDNNQASKIIKQVNKQLAKPRRYSREK